jgi:ABC-type amino acid transport substrate-binding protein
MGEIRPAAAWRPLLRGLGLGLAGLCLLWPPARAGAVFDQVKAAAAVRVCIWPDYYGITYRDPRTRTLGGLDIDLSRELGRDLGLRIDYVDSSFATVIADVTSGRCDVAMFAVGTLPERLQHLRFTRAYLESDIYGVTTRSNPVVRQWSDIDRPGVVVAVAAGTFMEPVMKQRLKHAQLVSVRAPDSRERELESGRVDVFMTDYPYSRRLLDIADWAMLLEPPGRFHVLPYAYAVRPGDDAWFAAIDAFVARIQADGRLQAAARRHGLSPIVRLR